MYTIENECSEKREISFSFCINGLNINFVDRPSNTLVYRESLPLFVFFHFEVYMIENECSERREISFSFCINGLNINFVDRPSTTGHAATSSVHTPAVLKVKKRRNYSTGIHYRIRPFLTPKGRVVS